MRPGDRVVYHVPQDLAHLDPKRPVSHSGFDLATGTLSAKKVLVRHGDRGVVQERHPDGFFTDGLVVQFASGVVYLNEKYLRPWVPDMRDLAAVERWLQS